MARRFYIYVVFYEFFLDGLQFTYIGELFPTPLRAKGELALPSYGQAGCMLDADGGVGMNIGVVGICLMKLHLAASYADSFQFHLVEVLTCALVSIHFWRTRLTFIACASSFQVI